MNVIILCYAISPEKGSEFAFGWDYVNAISKHHNIHLVYGVSGNKIGQTEELINFFKESPIENVKLYPVKANSIVSFFDFLNQLGLPWFWYIAFKYWHQDAKIVVKSILDSHYIDLIHTLNPQGFREPGYLWDFDKPHVWGPIGGANLINTNLLSNQSAYNKVKFKLRNFITIFQLRFYLRIKKSAKISKSLIFSTTSNLNNFKIYVNYEGPVISEMGFPVFRYKKSLIKYSVDDKLKIVWAGTISSRKNIQFLLDAISKCKFKNRIELNIIGDGELNEINKLKEFSIKNDISNYIKWHGRKSRNQTIDMFSLFHLHAIVSLSEASTSVLYEALSVCLPTISLDQDGMSDALSNGIGFLIPISDYENTVTSFSNKIDEIIENPSLLEISKNNIDTNKNIFTWEEKIKKFLNIYDQSL